MIPRRCFVVVSKNWIVVDEATASGGNYIVVISTNKRCCSWLEQRLKSRPAAVIDVQQVELCSFVSSLPRNSKVPIFLFWTDAELVAVILTLWIYLSELMNFLAWLSGQMLSVSVCVWILSRVAQMITVEICNLACADLIMMHTKD